MKLKILLFIIFPAVINAQNELNLNVGEIKQKKYHVAFDFENVNGRIIIAVNVNDRVKKFLLDTGAPTSFHENMLKEINYKTVIQNSQGIDANGASGAFDIIQIPEFSIQDITFLNNYALKIVGDLDFECLNLDGVIGSNSLRDSVVEFDFKAGKVTISSDFNTFGYGEVNENELIFKDFQSTPILKINMKLGYLNYNEEVIFDTGDNSFYSISINNLNQLLTLINENKIPKELQNISHSDLLGIISSSNGSFSSGLFGVETVSNHYKFKIQDFTVGSSVFDNMIATTTYGSNSRVGSEILNYGKLILDYKREKYYFI
ncbi:retropepsin-like aspartic protease, partial [Flavobacterium sp.]